MTTAVAVTAALLAALTFAVAAVLQQAAAASVPETQSLHPRLLLSLLRQPLWLAGGGVGRPPHTLPGGGAPVRPPAARLAPSSAPWPRAPPGCSGTRAWPPWGTGGPTR